MTIDQDGHNGHEKTLLQGPKPGSVGDDFSYTIIPSIIYNMYIFIYNMCIYIYNMCIYIYNVYIYNVYIYIYIIYIYISVDIVDE